MIAIEEAVAKEAPAEPTKTLQYYAFACIYSKQWFLCRSRRKRFKQLVLLYRLTCVPTQKPICITTRGPAVGGVYADTDGNVVECLEVEWV